jgi:hypothetical protein
MSQERSDEGMARNLRFDNPRPQSVINFCHGENFVLLSWDSLHQADAPPLYCVSGVVTLRELPRNCGYHLSQPAMPTKASSERMEVLHQQSQKGGHRRTRSISRGMCFAIGSFMVGLFFMASKGGFVKSN